MKTTGIVRCAQPRAIVLGVRSGRKLEIAPEAMMAEILARLTTLI